MTGSYIVKTLGCKANFYDSQIIEAELQKRGWSPAGSDLTNASLCIVNSCTVTDEADRQTRKLASRLARENPAARVVVTGCAAEVDPERLAKSAGIHYIVGNQDKLKLVDLVLEVFKKPRTPSFTDEHPSEAIILGSAKSYDEMLSRHPMDRDWPDTAEQFLTPPVSLAAAHQGQTSRTRSFLKIQEGCNSFCTYCVIPYGRGPSRSIAPEQLTDQIRQLVAQGCREVVLTGTNIGDYGTDWGDEAPNGVKFAKLCSQILAETTLERLRVGSLDPTEITPELISLMEREPRFCRHFHVSLQSPHSRILRLMKRRYMFEQVESCLTRISAVGAFIGMDVITGFPGETEEEFEWTREVLSRLPWNRIHVFPYSERAGTPATRLPGSVPIHERQRRTKLLNRLSLERLTRHCEETLSRSARTGDGLHEVLLEGAARVSNGERKFRAGYTRDYLRVLVPFEKSSRNDLCSVRPMSLFADPASGEVSIIGEVVH